MTRFNEEWIPAALPSWEISTDPRCAGPHRRVGRWPGGRVPPLYTHLQARRHVTSERGSLRMFSFWHGVK